MEKSNGLKLEELLRSREKLKKLLHVEPCANFWHTTPELYKRLMAQKKGGIRVGGYNSSPSTLSYGQPESRNGESAESNESQIILICYLLLGQSSPSVTKTLLD